MKATDSQILHALPTYILSVSKNATEFDDSTGDVDGCTFWPVVCCVQAGGGRDGGGRAPRRHPAAGEEARRPRHVEDVSSEVFRGHGRVRRVVAAAGTTTKSKSRLPNIAGEVPKQLKTLSKATATDMFVHFPSPLKLRYMDRVNLSGFYGLKKNYSNSANRLLNVLYMIKFYCC
jgi:hypothetical protein